MIDLIYPSLTCGAVHEMVAAMVLDLRPITFIAEFARWEVDPILLNRLMINTGSDDRATLRLNSVIRSLMGIPMQFGFSNRFDLCYPANRRIRFVYPAVAREATPEPALV